MIKLKENKHLTEDKPIEKFPLPAKVYLPLSQHLGKPCIPQVGVGDSVLRGQKIASVQAPVSAPVHASISGKVSAVQDYPHPLLGRSPAIVIETDHMDKFESQNHRRDNEVEGLNASEIRQIVLEAGIVGMGGAAFPAHIKLNPPKPVDTLIVNAAECEPYLTSDYRLMLEKTRELILGIELVARSLGVKEKILAIEDNKPEAVKEFKLHGPKLLIKVLPSKYPQGGEKQLIKNILGKEVPRGKLPYEVSVVVHNVATIFAIYEAVYLNKPLYERIVTITGGLLANPKNLLVRLGTPIKELIAFCGPLADEPAKIIMGGPMMGISQFTDDVPIIKSSGGVVLFNGKEARTLEEEFCIRCGACVRECPVGLMPCLINLASEKSLWPQAKTYGANDCIECGVCSYVCPANRRLVQSIKRAKLEIGK